MNDFDHGASLSLEELRRRFPVSERVNYLNHAATGPISRGVQEAIRRQTEIHTTQHETATERYEPVFRECRESVARLVGTSAAHVAFVQNTSHGISLLANGQDWRAGDNVIVPEMEFPSNYLAWLNLADRGVELRRLKVVQGRATAEELSRAIDDRTRVVALSHVQYFNGFRADLSAIAEVAHARNALLVVDGTQSVGAVPIDVEAMGIDALVVSAHKWMLGPLGIGFMALSGEMLARTRVTQLGWLSVNDPFAFNREIDLPDNATRFEPGTENAAGIFGLAQRIREIEAYTIEGIERRILHLNDRFADLARRHGFEVRSPMEAGARSGILSFHHPAIADPETVAYLRDRGIHIGFREGALRVSPHYYNSEDEIDELAAALVEKSGIR
ncbi:MAG: aminotransferase class V-fold PLP-dependent enzyme [Thalassobaculum sp.]|uniref:aminotransferase class V-fold PLP-dependent enzyme n=1 Tax=Thalassobaculum sp. TaxID=2022740 RepID=UPI0032F00D7F